MISSPILTFMSGPEDGSVIQPATQGSIQEIVFGRVATCAVTLLHDPSVSRRHSRLYWRENSWWLEDLGSSNGTFVDEFSLAVKVIAPVRLRAGQVFQVGKTRFRFDLTDQQSAAASATAQAIVS